MSAIRERFERLQRLDCTTEYNCGTMEECEDGDYLSRADVLALADELDREQAQAMDVLKLALERHRQPAGEMCSCGGCLAVHRAIRMLKESALCNCGRDE